MGHQFCTCLGARPGAEAHLLREQGLTRPKIEVPVTRESDASGSILNTKAPPLFPQLHSGGDDKPPGAVELSEFDIQYEPRGSIKGQVYADFVAELSPGGDPQEVELGAQWMLSVDGSSNQQGSGAGIILEGPNGVLIE